MEDKKKIQAAIAGVYCYLASEEEQQPCGNFNTNDYPSPWALSGRQTIMQWRSLVQSRSFKR